MLYLRAGFGIGNDIPIWPPVAGLLAPEWRRRPQEEWSAAQWAEYAQLLERAGYDLVEQLEAALGEAAVLRAKSSRRPKSAEPVKVRGLLECLAALATPGRPRGSETQETARLALAVKEELQQTKKRVTDVEALAELYRRTGKRQSRAKLDRTVTNAMSLLRRNHKNQAT